MLFPSFFFFFLREREGKGRRNRETNINVWLPLARPPTRDLAHNLGRCPDWESTRGPFGSQANTQSTESHQPGAPAFLIMKENRPKSSLRCQARSASSAVVFGKEPVPEKRQSLSTASSDSMTGTVQAEAQALKIAHSLEPARVLSAYK